MMFSVVRKFSKSISLFLLVSIISSLYTNVAWALSSGPSQPETQQFAPAGMDDMVDAFTGDFSYNIPLLDVGGYPVNLNYAAGITPDAEASWTGLGWNLNVGAINRNLRGLADDFAGDEVIKEYNVKPNQTYGVTGILQGEFFGIKKKGLGLSANLFYNNYNGFGMTSGVSASVSAGLGSKSNYTANMGLSLSLGSESGLEVSPTIGLSPKQAEDGRRNGLTTKVGFPYSTQEGLKGMTLSASYNKQYTKSKEGAEGVVTSKEVNRNGLSRPKIGLH